MMMKFKKIIGSLALAAVVSTAALSAAVIAAPAQVASAASTQGTCTSDYYSFVGTVRSPEDTSEYIKDFFRSYCKVNDLLELYDELDALRKDFKNAAYNCGETSDYKKEYKRILMEMYFIRHLQNANSGTLSEEDADDIEKQKETLLDNLEEEMSLEFVNGDYVSKSTFEDYFEVWRAKYDDRVGAYAMCSEGPLGELQETVSDFVSTLGSLDFKIDKPVKEESFWQKLKPDVDVDPTTVGIFEYVKSAFTKSEEELGPPPSIEDAKENASTLEGALDFLIGSDSAYDAALQSENRMKRYQLLYGSGSAVAVTDMQSVIRTINAIVEEANSKDLPNIQAGTSKVFDKQCN